MMFPAPGLRVSASAQARSWEEVSSDVMAFIQALLQKDLTQRLTAAAALEHPWLRDLAPNASELWMDLGDEIGVDPPLKKVGAWKVGRSFGVVWCLGEFLMFFL